MCSLNLLTTEFAIVALPLVMAADKESGRVENNADANMSIYTRGTGLESTGTCGGMYLTPAEDA
jgi:hypothetical protein